MEVQRYQIPQQQNSIPSYFKQRSKSKHIFLRMWNANLVSSFVDINISSSLRVTQQYNWTLPLLCIAVSSLLSSLNVASMLTSFGTYLIQAYYQHGSCAPPHITSETIGELVVSDLRHQETRVV